MKQQSITMQEIRKEYVRSRKFDNQMSFQEMMSKSLEIIETKPFVRKDDELNFSFSNEVIHI
ncbi:TPA: hypothetical protein ACN337_003379 [Vibrio parahaemolyticus]|uniref:hypothetical protein n=1 Tax=Vibrio parahaemolyticus TaxID=670 RepID=UPI0009F012B7|nr:hypothetical protein [Vibrio parahaemolyticus]OQU28464.1 hypothetical protein EM47_003215 [Vibrio parahaemolyticus]